MKTYRPERVGGLILEELNKIILREFEFKDALVTFTRAEVPADLQRAIVGVSVYPSEKGEEVLRILRKFQKKFRYLLLKKMNIKPMPQIEFKIDTGYEEAAKVERGLLDEKAKNS